MADLTHNRSYRKYYYNNYLSLGGEKKDPELKDYRQWAKATETLLKNWLPPDRNAPILDMGCGSGKFLFMLEQMGYTDLTGVDLSPEQIDRARQWCPGSRIIQSDVRAFLQDNAERFQLITGFDVLEHFGKEELLGLLSLIKGALTAGGRVIFQTPNALSPWAGTVAYGDFTHEWFFTPGGLDNLLSLQGFTRFEARACEPRIHGLKSLMRACLWQLLKLGYGLVNLIETGGAYDWIFTRVFVGTAVKP
ncbi:MAG: class I SAM-dependent methyltransferase [Desulfobaccales bacterium]